MPHDQDRDPELDPVFVNRTEVMVVGDDVFLDLGVIKPSDIASLSAGEAEQPSVIDFYLLQRVVMSKANFGELFKQVVRLQEAMVKKPLEQPQQQDVSQ